MRRPLQKCVGNAYHDHHDETFTKTLKLPTLPSFILEEAPPNYNDCINDCPPDYTDSDASATLNLDPPADAPSLSASKCSSRERREESHCSTKPKVDFGYRENLREHKKKKKGAAAKNKWDSDNEEEKKPEGDNNGDQPGDAGGSGGADGAGGEGGGNDDDDWDDRKKKGKKDKKKGALSWDALEDEGNKDEEEKTDDSPPVEEAPAEEDDWAGFTTASSKKKKKKGKNADPEPPPDDPKPDDGPPKVDVDFGNSNTFSFGSNGAWGTKPAEDDGWATFGGSKKDKKKKANAFNFGFGDVDDGAMPGESVPSPAEEEAKADDNPWAAFGSGKKKNKGGAVEEPPLPSPEPEPEVVVAQSADEPADDFSWAMSSKDKKKAKKAAKAAALAAPEPEPEPVVVVEEAPPEPEAPPAEPEPAPVDDFSWGMSAKDKKKAKKAAKKSAFDWSEPDPPAAPDPPAVEEAQPNPDESTALAIPEPSQDDWFDWGTAGKKKGKKNAEEIPPEVPPPPLAAPKPAVEESSSSWSFGWGSSSKKDKKKSKSPEPEPVIVPEPVLKDPVVMVPESIDEPKAEEDDWAGWATGKKSKKKGSKNVPVEIVEPVYDVPVQQPDPAPAEEDAWAGWSVGKKEKKKSKKADEIPPPSLPAIEPPPVEVVEPEVEVLAPPPELEAPVEQPPADDPWASFSTKKSKKDKKKKGSSTEETKPVLEVPPPPPEPELKQLVDSQEPKVEPEPIVVLDSSPAEKPVKEVKKKEVKTSSGWGSSLWGSSSKSKSSSKDREKEKEREKKEKEEKERQEREAEEQRKADEEAAFAAALADEPVDVLPEPAPAATTGYWGTFLKPTAVSMTVEEPIVSKGKVDTGAKESVKDRIKRLQGETTKDQVVVVPPPPPAPEPLPEPDVVVVPEPEVVIVPEPELPVVEEASAKKSSKDKRKKKGKEKEPSPPPPPAAIEIPPPVAAVPPSLSPIPGGFPEDDVEVDVLADVPAVPPAIVTDTSADAPVEPPSIDAVKPSEEVMPKPSSDKKPVKDKGVSAKKEVKNSIKSSRPAVVDLSAPSTPAAESKSVKKERPKVVRDPTGSSHWGLWGTTPKAEAKKERRPSKDTTTPTVKRSAAPGLTRSKSARKPNERDFLEKADKTSSDDKQSRKGTKDPATPAKSMGFSLFGPTPTRSRSMRQSSSTQRPAQVRDSRRSLDVSSPPGDIASKAAKLIGLGPRPTLSRSQSTREKRKSRNVPGPYAIDPDNTPDDTTHSASVDRSSSHRTKRSSRSDHKHDKRDSAMMSGGLGPAVDDGGDLMTAAEDTPFVTPSRPMLRRSATTSARKPSGGLFSNIIDSLKPKPVEDFSRRYRSSQAYDSEDGSTRHRRHLTPHSSHRDEDDDSKRHLRREHRRVRRPEDVPSTPLDEHAPTPPVDNTESEDRGRRRAERRAKRAALEAAEEELRAREKASRHREREEIEHDRQDLEDQRRRQRRAERHASRRSSAIDADRKPHLHRSSTAPVQSYFDARAPHRDANGRDLRSPPKDKTSSWVHSVTSSPPLPPPLQPTILDIPPTDSAADDADLHDDESTARELRRRHRRDRESRGIETEEDRKRRKRKELRRREEELASRDRDGEARRDRGSNKAYNSLGYDGFETQRTWDGRVVGGETRGGGVKEEIARRTQGWSKKVAGL
ncbi:hypothetical protein KCU91_g6863, partial [Aureobasidium melanogenum]